VEERRRRRWDRFCASCGGGGWERWSVVGGGWVCPSPAPRRSSTSAMFHPWGGRPVTAPHLVRAFVCRHVPGRSWRGGGKERWSPCAPGAGDSRLGFGSVCDAKSFGVFLLHAFKYKQEIALRCGGLQEGKPSIWTGPKMNGLLWILYTRMDVISDGASNRYEGIRRRDERSGGKSDHRRLPPMDPRARAEGTDGPTPRARCPGGDTGKPHRWADTM